MKNCITCQRGLPIDAFYKHPQMADGHLNKCKECVKNYQKTRPYAKKYEASRANLPHRVEARRKYSKTPEGKAAHKRAHQKQKLLFPKKVRARYEVSNALRDGRMEKPEKCSECMEKCKPHGHHDDYSKPLEVRWLCTSCHRKWHNENGGGANGD